MIIKNKVFYAMPYKNLVIDEFSFKRQFKNAIVIMYRYHQF